MLINVIIMLAVLILDYNKLSFRVIGNVDKVFEYTEAPQSLPVKLLDPLKVVVTTGGTEKEVVAVVDELPDGRFYLDKIYHAQPKKRLIFDIIFPNK